MVGRPTGLLEAFDHAGIGGIDGQLRIDVARRHRMELHAFAGEERALRLRFAEKHLARRLFVRDHHVLDERADAGIEAVPPLEVDEPADVGVVELGLHRVAQELVPLEALEADRGPGARVDHPFSRAE